MLWPAPGGRLPAIPAISVHGSNAAVGSGLKQMIRAQPKDFCE